MELLGSQFLRKRAILLFQTFNFSGLNLNIRYLFRHKNMISETISEMQFMKGLYTKVFSILLESQSHSELITYL